MAHLADFENTLKDVVNAKRLSASKMTRLTEIAMKSLEHDTKLVAILYRTHKSLSSTAKVSSLYAFDALARAARSYAVKRGITGDINSSIGNAATFLLKVEGVLDGLFQDMIVLDNAEAKEKTKKVLDIWTKSNTFPSPVLARLREIMEDRKESVKNPTPPIAPVEAQALPIITTPSSTTPSQHPTPPLPDSMQSTLLALLGQAAQAAGQPQTRIQTPPNTVSAPPLGLALLQQLALKVNTANGSPLSQPGIQLSLQNAQQPSALLHLPPPSHLNNQPHSSAQSHTHNDPSRDPRQSRSGQPELGKERDGCPDVNSRGGFQRGFRGRGRGRGRWEDRDHDRFKDRDWNSSTTRPGRSRSRSPRRFNGQRPRQYSPPQRPASRDVAQTSSAAPEVGKDEFGRDIRPSSATPPRAVSVDVQPQLRTVSSVDPAPTAAPENRVPESDQLPSVAVSTSTQNAEPRRSSSVPTLQQPGLDQFDFTTFDFTAPSSWEGLGKMWHVTYGGTPSQEELMQFVMTGGTVAAFSGQTNAVQVGQWQNPSWGSQSAGSGRGWRGGRGRGMMTAGRGDDFGHGKYRNGGYWGEDAQHSDAIVLGEVGNQDTSHSEGQSYADLAQTGRDDDS